VVPDPDARIFVPDAAGDGISGALINALASIAGAVVVCDANGSVLLCSPLAEALLGPLTGMDATAVDAQLVSRAGPDQPSPEGLLSSALNGSGSPPMALTLTTHEGGTAEVLVGAVPLATATGERVGAVLTLGGAAALHGEAQIFGLHDVLTGLPNRRLLADRIEQAIARSRRGGNFAVLMIDLDGFKQINDQNGHEYGDALLRGIGARLRRTVRPNDTVARIGGDEFVVVCEGTDSEDRVEVLARRLLKALAAPLRIRDRDVKVGASIGIVLADPNKDSEELLRCADLAMYEAKRGGRNRWAHFDAELDRSAQRSDRLTKDLRLAIEAGELEVAYQPLVDLEKRTVAGYEALVRWYHPELGTIPASEVIQTAEHSEMILKLGAFVLDRACAQAARWSSQPGPLTISVNISASELTGPDLIPRILDTLARHGLTGSQLCLEITERTLMAVGAEDSEALRRLREAGISIAIDNFGTGFASLTYLQQLPVQEVKIDRSVIAGLPDNRQDDAVVTSVLALAHSLDLTVIAEGVETLDQSVFLRTLGCDLGQGDYFGSPQPGDEIGESVATTAANADGADARTIVRPAAREM
jgi:diguanylate cyclase (GGDEF)-like protein